MERYPQLICNLPHLRDNITNMYNICKESGIEPCWVVKGVNANLDILSAYKDCGCKKIGSSRFEQLKIFREHGIGEYYQLLRIPMISEAENVVEYADESLNSEHDVLVALNEAAKKKNKIHNVILMIEMGDLREGYYDREELVKEALAVENDFSNLYLKGLGMNVGCYGSIVPTLEKMEEFVSVCEMVEEKLGRKVDVISGSGSSSFMRIVANDMPKRVNEIRIGGEPFISNTVKNIYHNEEKMKWMHEDVFVLRAEIVELKVKPTYPNGELGVDAFGHKPTYIDRGIRLRGILGVGKLDIGNPSDLLMLEKGVEVLGGSSDHTIVDLEDYYKKDELKIGYTLDFRPMYSHVMYMTNSPYVNIKYIR